MRGGFPSFSAGSAFGAPSRAAPHFAGSGKRKDPSSVRNRCDSAVLATCARAALLSYPGGKGRGCGCRAAAVRREARGRMGLTVAEIKCRLQEAGEQEFAVLERSLVADTRKGVREAVEVARRRLAADRAVLERLARLYAYERELAAGRGAGIVVGLDEVGRGPLAGPLAVGAVVLPFEPVVQGLNDSKQVKPEARERIALEVKRVAVAWTVEYVEAADIDACGMTASLVMAFRRAIARIEGAGARPDVVLLDGNPLRLDSREVNVVKGDGRCASIAAASIVAKVERDALMCRYAEQYPEYGFDSCKGYASAAHIEAIKRYGLTPIHRATFCTAFTQPTLF